MFKAAGDEGADGNRIARIVSATPRAPIQSQTAKQTSASQRMPRARTEIGSSETFDLAIPLKKRGSGSPADGGFVTLRTSVCGRDSERVR